MKFPYIKYSILNFLQFRTFLVFFYWNRSFFCCGVLFDFLPSNLIECINYTGMPLIEQNHIAISASVARFFFLLFPLLANTQNLFFSFLNKLFQNINTQKKNIRDKWTKCIWNFLPCSK